MAGRGRLGWAGLANSPESKPVFLELLFGKNDNLMIHAGDDWFYKKPGVEWVDVTLSAGRWRRAKPFPMSVFAPQPMA